MGIQGKIERQTIQEIRDQLQDSTLRGELDGKTLGLLNKFCQVLESLSYRIDDLDMTTTKVYFTDKI